MRKNVLCIVLSVLCILLAFGLTSCGDEHIHDYQWVNNGDGTHQQHCAVDDCPTPDIQIGSHSFSDGACVCGEPVPHAHIYDQEVVSDTYLMLEANCIAKAVYFKSCKCGEKGTETFAYGSPAPHTYTEVVKNTYLKTEASCTAKAVYYKSCSCGAQSTETFETGSMLPHVYTQVVQDRFLKTEASCTANAVYYKSCACGAQGTETFEEGVFAAHQFTSWVDEVAATCSATGTKGHKDCGVCLKHFDINGNEIADLTIAKDADAHRFGSWVGEVAATCNATGTKGHKDCTLCLKHFDINGNEIADLTIAKDLSTHQFGNWQTVTPADCEHDGEKSRTCGVCSTTETATIDALNHDWDEPTYVWAADYSTCTATRVCKNDAAHTETETATAQLQTSTQATASSFGEGKYTVTFTNAAFSSATSPIFAVSADGETYQPQDTYEWTPGSGSFVCTVTKVCVSDPTKTITETANVTLETIKAATCTKEGEGRYVATFTNPAFATQYSDTVVLPLAPHYITPGNMGSDGEGHWDVCDSGCGEKLHFAEHTPGDWEITVEPTFLAEGEQAKKCTVCKYVLETEVLPILTNDWNGTTVAGSFEGGSGTASDPFLIKTGAQMKYLANLINTGVKGYSTAYYKLVDDIDLGGHEWAPIGCLYITSQDDASADRAFSGTFDGNGYIVSNFKITEEQQPYFEYYGLFGRVAGGTVKNLGVENFTINVKKTGEKVTSFIGGLAGMIINKATVTNCYTANGTVGTTNDTVGYIKAGGFAGAISQSTVSYCFSAADVVIKGSISYAGGFAGDVYNSSKITSVLAIGNVTASAHGIGKVYVGGLCGDASGTFTTKYIYKGQVVLRGTTVYNPTDATKCTLDSLNSKTFYTNTLKLSETIWDFSALDIENGQLPKLRPGVSN